MKNYYLILIENFIGIGYLILFLFGFFINNQIFTYIGGIGMFVFMVIMVKDQPKKLFFFLLICAIGSTIGYFVSEWWLGTFWAAAVFSAGQIFGIIALLKNKYKIIDGIENAEIGNENMLRFMATGKTTDPDKLIPIELLLFIALIIAPYLITKIFII